MKSLRALVLLAALLALGACSSFERKWADARPRGDAFAGRWDGKWTSAKHHAPFGGPAGGRLRCLLTKLDARHYRGEFRADWLYFSSGYTTVFDAERRGAELRLRGEHDLGPIFGGIYKYEGRVTAARFRACYDSSYDRGTFEMAKAK